ncbi:MAG: Clp protease N-terminal domain-containing protein [Omnitrophica WOR_2 bacterium]
MTIDYLTPDEVASNLQVSRQVVYNWINDGRLRAVKAGRTLRIPRYALEAFLQPVNAGDIRTGDIEPDHSMPIDRFTPAAQAVTPAMINEVLTRQHLQAEVEHLLLALVKQEDGIVPQVLQQMGVDPHQVAQQLDQALEKLPEDPTIQHSPQRMVISERIPKILDRAEELASLLPDLQIDNRHIFQAICEEAEGVSAQILQSFGVTPERLRVVLSELPATPPPAPHEAAQGRAGWEQRIEQQLTRIETELAAIRSMLTRPGSGSKK